MNEHRQVQDEAVRIEAEGHRRLLASDPSAAEPLREAAAAYRRSWELAPPTAFGRLVGMLKAAVLAGGGEEEARYARDQVGEAAETPTSSYALAVAALVLGDDEAAERAAGGMRGGSDAFDRAADAIAALARADAAAYAAAVRAIVADFEARSAHLTGVAIADTALMFERLAERRGLAARVSSPLLPPAG